MRIVVTSEEPKKEDTFISWVENVNEKLETTSSTNEELQIKIKILQATLQTIIKEQQIYHQNQQICRKQLTTLRAQINIANSSESELLIKKIKTLETEIANFKAPIIATELNSQLNDLQKEYRSIKANTEQLAKMNVGFRTQLSGVIADSERQMQQCMMWQEEFNKKVGEQNKAQLEELTELQIQLSQIKMALCKRIAELEKSVGGLETKYSHLQAEHQVLVKKVDPVITAGEKLLKLRQAMLEDKFISDELKYYIAPNGEAQPGLREQEPLYEWVEANFLDAKIETRVLLLQGQAGAGKSTFNRFLLKHLWQNKSWDVFKPGDKAPACYLPVFIPLGLKQINPVALLKYLTDLPELTEDFTETEVNVLKRDYHLLLIADGYDEMPGRQSLNLYDANQLEQYSGRIKLLISCRSERVQELNEVENFTPHDKNGSPRYEFFKRRYVSPFSDTQIFNYISKYITQNKDHGRTALWKNVKTYEKYFNYFSELKVLMKNPFLLLMAIEVLPTIVAQLKTDDINDEFKKPSEEIAQITRAKLYDIFMEHWFKREAEKARLAGDTTPSKILVARYRQFCLKFAECLRAACITSVQYPFGEEQLFEEDLFSVAAKPAIDPQGPQGPWVKKLFGMENEIMISARKGAPLLIAPGNYYQFIHASLIDYFLTTAIVRQAETKSHSIVPARPVANLELADTESSPIENLISNGLLTKDQVLLLVDRLMDNPHLEKILFNFIERSKTELMLAKGAANAITVLNAARRNFSGRDFRGIRIPGADLSFALLDNTRFQGSDLRGVNLTGAWLRKANLSRSVLRDVCLGEWPTLILSSPVYSCAYSRDGRWLAIGCENKEIYLYFSQNATFTLKYTLKGHDDRVDYIKFIGDSELASNGTLGSMNKNIMIWDVRTGKCSKIIPRHRGFSNAYDISSEHIAEGGKDGFDEHEKDPSLYLRNIKTGDERKLIGHRRVVKTLVFDSGGEQLASGSDDGTIRLWSVSSGVCNRIIVPGGFVDSLAFDRKGERLASGITINLLTHDYAIRVWQISSGACNQTLSGHKGRIHHLNFDGRGENLASGSGDNTIRLWQIYTGQCEQVFEGHNRAITGLTFNETDDRLISASYDGTVRQWQASTKLEENVLEKHAMEITSIVFNHSGQLLATAGYDGSVRLWDLSAGECVYVIPPFVFSNEDGRHKSTPPVTGLAFDRKDKLLALASFECIILWDLVQNRHVGTIKGNLYFENTTLVFDNKSLYLAILSECKVSLADIKQERLCEVNLKQDSFRVRNIRYAGNGQWWLAGINYENITKDHVVTTVQIQLWPAKDRVHKCLFKEEIGPISCMVLDEKICWLASGDAKDHTIRLWDISKRHCLWALKEHTDEITCLGFDRGGSRLASGSKDLTIRLWGVMAGACLAVIKGFTGPVKSLAWQSLYDGLYLATGGADKVVRYWKMIKNKKGGLKPILIWASHQTTLVSSGMRLDGAEGLNDNNRELLQQRGAKGTPAEFKSLESQKASSSPAKKDPTDIRGLAAPATRLGLLAVPSVPPIPTTVSVDAKAITEPKTL